MVLVRTTKADAAYRQIRRAIVTDEIGAGTPLDESHLIARFQIGRTPVREALKRLAAEEFIVAPPHRTPYVRPFSLTDLQPLFETRLLLEVPISGLAAERITPQQFADLERQLEAIQKAVANGDAYQAAEIDYAFHSAIALATQNRFLAESINQFNRASLRLWYLAHSRLGLETVADAHAAVLAGLRGRDRAAAEEVMQRHILASRERVIAAFVSDPQGLTAQ